MANRDYIRYPRPTAGRRLMAAVRKFLAQLVCSIQEGGAIDRQIEARKTEF